jgi:hypothetical protein
MTVEHLDRLLSVPGGDHLITAGSQHPLRDSTDALLIRAFTSAGIPKPVSVTESSA